MWVLAGVVAGVIVLAIGLAVVAEWIAGLMEGD